MDRDVLVIDDAVDPRVYEAGLDPAYSYALAETLAGIAPSFEQADVVVYDHGQPEMVFQELKETVRDASGSYYVVVVAGAEPTPELLSVPCDDYLHKPVDGDALKQAIDRAMAVRNGDRREMVSLTRKAQALDAIQPSSEPEQNPAFDHVRRRLRELARPEVLAEIERIDTDIRSAQLGLIRGATDGQRAARTDGGKVGESRPEADDISPWKFREAVESAGHAVVFTDTDGVIEYVNPAFEELTGYAESEVVGHTPRILKSGEHGEAVYEDLWETIGAGEVWRGELVNERPDGERYVIEQTIAPLPRDDEPRGYVAINTDITEKRRREEKIKALHEATRDLLSADSPSAVAAEVGAAIESILAFRINVIRVHRNGELRPCHVNDKAERLLSERPTYEVGEGFPGAAFEDQQARVYTDIRDHDGGAALEPVVSWLYVPISDYGVISVGQTEADAFDETDLNLVQIIASNAEIALQRLRKERALQRENERLEQFASTVSHDLRNPLQVAKGTLSQLDDCTAGVGRLRQAHERMEEVIEGVLTLTRQGDRVEDPSPVDLSAVARACWTHVSACDTELVVEADSLVVSGDDARLKHLFENLFRNAVTHGQASTIRVAALDNGFYVADDGVGIPPEERDSIFENGYTTSDDGTGLGLTIVKEIASAHGWDVSVTESGTGGARFEFITATQYRDE
ncbi:PAS domain S-box-containing protein [Haloarcula vallismortis]|uniref:histidine kinase n=2 Tax=Haloarcula vallismortis TaxID=28442 RepID=M0J438_HALVA|nr:PAS domain S-box protein [Haloarcula vallismortis]EMA03721.1 oxygen and light sensing his kinase [Haloarcula vallismortis ATCC 29715]SDW33457.1 PAS domain S-box-containing protein [Haloarcula vallismortis]